MSLQFGNFVDVVPFAAKQVKPSPHQVEIWWEDPRDIQAVLVAFSPGSAPQAGDVQVEYWRSSWPRVRVAKGAVVGAGESGWLANDDWTNGVWQPADCILDPAGDTWTFRFLPLNRQEFPAEVDFPAEFRRTLKLRLNMNAGGAQIARVAAFTDSTWQEAQVSIEWKALDSRLTNRNGHLEAFNGAVLQVQAANALTRLDGDHSWQSSLSGNEISGVVASVRYAENEDRNSFDDTILTLRPEVPLAGLPGVSFSLRDVLRDPVYLRDLGLLVRTAGQAHSFAAFEATWEAEHQPTLYQQIHQLPEQTWERSWLNMPRKTSRIYFTIGCEGSRQKFAVEPSGDLFITDTYIRKVPGKDTPRLGWQGRMLRFKLGLPDVEPGYRSILENTLPIIRTIWEKEEVVYDQEAYATWLWGDSLTERMPGDDPVVAMLRITFTNLSDTPKVVTLPMTTQVDEDGIETLAVENGWVTQGDRLRFYFDTGPTGDLHLQDRRVVYKAILPPGVSRAVEIRIPHIDLNTPAERERLQALKFDALKDQVAEFWRRRIAQGAQIVTPNETINHFYSTHLMHMLVINDREPSADRNVARCGGFFYGSFPDEGCMAIHDLDRRGYHAEAERCLELYVHYQSSVPLPGNFQSQEGVLYGSGGYEEAGYNRNHGWILWTLAEHYYYTRDRAWLERIAPALVKGCEWIIRERRATMQRGSISYGFLPSGSLEDVTDYWTWLATNAYAGWGFRAAAGVLGEIDHPEAARLAQEAEAFNRDLKAGFYEACARSPVVRLRDGRWVPHFPAHQERRGRDFGWLREVLEGASHLVYCGIIPPDDPAALWILEDYEDNLFLSDQYGYQADDFERQWFDIGGFSMQSNLLLFPPLYLWRDEPKHYLRAYFNAFTSAFFPDTVQMCEHALPDLQHWRGDHFKSSDEANSNSWLRLMLLAEHGDELVIGQAVPRAWLEHGQRISVQRAATHFGETSFEVHSAVATGSIFVRLQPPRRNPPRRIRLRLRHPAGQPVQEVWVNNLPHRDFDAQGEWINLPAYSTPLEIWVKYDIPTNPA